MNSRKHFRHNLLYDFFFDLCGANRRRRDESVKYKQRNGEENGSTIHGSSLSIANDNKNRSIIVPLYHNGEEMFKDLKGQVFKGFVLEPIAM
jgi:hypothetical protein